MKIFVSSEVSPEWWNPDFNWGRKIQRVSSVQGVYDTGFGGSSYRELEIKCQGFEKSLFQCICFVIKLFLKWFVKCFNHYGDITIFVALFYWSFYLF